MVRQHNQSPRLPQRSEAISGRQAILRSAPGAISGPARSVPTSPEKGASKRDRPKDSVARERLNNSANGSGGLYARE